MIPVREPSTALPTFCSADATPSLRPPTTANAPKSGNALKKELRKKSAQAAMAADKARLREYAAKVQELQGLLMEASGPAARSSDTSLVEWLTVDDNGDGVASQNMEARCEMLAEEGSRLGADAVVKIDKADSRARYADLCRGQVEAYEGLVRDLHCAKAAMTADKGKRQALIGHEELVQVDYCAGMPPIGNSLDERRENKASRWWNHRNKLRER